MLFNAACNRFYSKKALWEKTCAERSRSMRGIFATFRINNWKNFWLGTIYSRITRNRVLKKFNYRIFYKSPVIRVYNWSAVWQPDTS